MNILLIYPQYPDTFWSFKHAVKFISKKAAFPPLGLLTVASMIPAEWKKKVVDMNTTKLKNKDIAWADYVFISAMIIQKESVLKVIKLCKSMKKKIVAGGPLFTADYQEYDDVDHLVLNEAEMTLAPFLEDLKNGCAKHIYTSTEYPDITKTPIPMWNLLNMKKYFSMASQYSRGCPFDCEFCNVVVLNGHRPRTKTSEQMLNELNALYLSGWRGEVLIVDDNFIGNKNKLKAEVLPDMQEWMKLRNYPFRLSTEVSINIADDDELINKMVGSNFTTLFIGIESPNEDSLIECGKKQNKNRDMVASVKKLQNFGFQIHGGFIVGFDSDPSTIFENQIDFIQKSGIVTAMVGLLNAPKGTKLYKRLMEEKRLLGNITGDNTDLSMNFVPEMDQKTLMDGYKNVLNTIYSNKHYYERIKTFFKEYKPRKRGPGRPKLVDLKAFMQSIWIIGIKERGRKQYWNLIGSTLVKRPKMLPMAVTLAIYGFHLRKVTRAYVKLAC
ncbi:MAG: DUF4070 domain-containing protein [Chloroflexi bacterium]|nr:DUF4070 domain-containing protein [Chloroflexota bacterium]